MRQRPFRSALICACVFPLLSVAADDGSLPPEIDLLSGADDYVLTVRGDVKGDMIGLDVSAGDIDGDGFADAILCAGPGGKAYVLFGSAALPGETVVDMAEHPGGVLTVYGDFVNDTWPAFGDVNGDGYGDAVITGWLADPLGREDAGVAYVLFGGPDIAARGTVDVTAETAGLLKIYGKSPHDRLGFAAASGDVNGDGYDDILVGAQFADPVGRIDAGEVYVVFGSSDIESQGDIDLRDDAVPVLTILGHGYGADYPDNLGWGLGAGDIDGDGIDDVIVGSRFADPDGRTNSGEVYVIYGFPMLAEHGVIDLRDPGSPPSGMTRIRGARPHDYFGNSISTGDVDGDGIADLLVNAYAVDFPARENAGTTFVFPGSPDLPARDIIRIDDPATRMVRIEGAASEDHLGPTSVGDLDGDGIGDIVQGALNHDAGGRIDAGAVWLIYGGRDFFDRERIDLRTPPDGVVKLLGREADDRLGLRNAVGDMDGDGIDDAVISAHGASPHGKYRAGETYIFWGGGRSAEPPQRFVFEANTGSNAVILIPADDAPNLFGVPIERGDEVGVFTPGGLCAGAGVWRGDNLAVTVWGDDPFAEGVNGFAPGERYVFRIIDRSAGKVYSAQASFAEGSGVFEVDGISVLAALSTETATAEIVFARGWNLVSSPVAPRMAALDSLTAAIHGDLVLMKNGAGDVFWPEYGIDGIGSWEAAHGYQAYMRNGATLTVEGYRIDGPDLPFRLATGWNLIGYTGPDGIAPVEAFAAAGERIVAVKNGAGDIWWPRQDIDDLREMRRGAGFWVYSNGPAAFTFPAAPAGKVSGGTIPRPTPAHFTPCSNTGGNATLLIRTDISPVIDGVPVGEGDEIAVFSENGVCAGAAVWLGDRHLALVVWGDDAMTPEIDGMPAGGGYRFRIWDRETDTEYEAAATYSEGSPQYAANALVVLESLTAGTGPVEVGGEPPLAFSLGRNRPNPFNPSTLIPFILARDCRVRLTVYNLAGERVAELVDGVLPAGAHEVTWNASGLASGVYLVRLEAGGFVGTGKMTLVK